MGNLEIEYTDYALERLCGDLELKLLRFVESLQDRKVPNEVAGDTGDSPVYESHQKLFDGGELILTCREQTEAGRYEVSARLVEEPQPLFHSVGLALAHLRSNLANGSGDPFGLLREYRSRHGAAYADTYA